MTRAPTPRHRPLTLIRVTVSLLLVAHGAARVGLSAVDDFGIFLVGALSLPGSLAMGLAWLLTTVEIVGGSTLAAGRAPIILSVWFSCQLLVGIGMVHAPEGWFVVGVGRNGAEYSVLMIACLAAVACDAWAGPRLRVPFWAGPDPVSSHDSEPL